MIASDLSRRIGVGVEARDITKVFPVERGELLALDHVTLTAAPGSFVTILGPSGSGKSTLFNILAGLDRPTTGQVFIGGQDVTGRTGVVAYMPQRDLLLPWKTVLDNTALGLELRGVPRSQARREALALFPRFGLEGFAREYPATLSGGMRQRAALLRTVLTRRDVLLLDEPFGALDALTRMDLQQWLLEIWQSLQKTAIFITHDIEEAIYLADQIYLMTPRPGRISAVLDVDLPRPRPYDETVTSAPFVALKHQILTLLREER